MYNNEKIHNKIRKKKKFWILQKVKIRTSQTSSIFVIQNYLWDFAIQLKFQKNIFKLRIAIDILFLFFISKRWLIILKYEI